jgi:glycosyltransferase involved in cell wall biosynthesis
MNLLYVIASMDPVKGGPCQYIRNTMLEMQKLGICSEVVCIDNPVAPFLTNDLFTIHALGPGKTSWCYSPKLIPWLLKNLHRFDVVFLNGLWLYPGYAIRVALRQIRQQQASLKKGIDRIPKLFVMPHGMLDPYFQKAPGRTIKAIRNWVYWKMIECKVVNEAAGLLFTCQTELELARMPFRPYRPKLEFNVGLGIADPPAYNSRMRNAFLKKCPGLETSSYILFLSRIHEKKGVDLLIKSYANIASKILCKGKHPTSEFTFNSERETDSIHLPKLVIAGPGIETPYGKKLQLIAWQDSRLRDYILFPGMLAGDAKWGAYYGCEAFILPSHQENFGISVVEALACHKPVLISNQINIWKEIDGAGAGIVAGDTLRDTQIMLCNWYQLASAEKVEMGKRARACFERMFSTGPALKRLLDTFKA